MEFNVVFQWFYCLFRMKARLPDGSTQTYALERVSKDDES